MEHGFDEDINILDLDLTGVYGGYDCRSVTKTRTIGPGSSQEFRFACAFIDDVNDDFRGSLILRYKLEGENLPHTLTGLIKTKII